MGTIGLNFGAATSGQGFDVTATVSQIVAGYQAVEAPWKSTLASLTQQDAAFSQIGTDLAALATKLQALTDFQGVLAAKKGSSSDTNLLALTAAQSTATEGSHTVVVSQLAQSDSWYSGALASGALVYGSITVQSGSGSPVTLSLDPAGETLSSVAARINAAGAGVSGNVISDANGGRLSLVSSQTGAANAITITSNLTDGTNAVAFQHGQTAQDASLTVDGVSLTSASNSVSGAIPGVTFQILKADPATSVQVQITSDSDAVTSAVSGLVAAYNAVTKDLNGQEGKDASGNAKPLFGNPELSLLQQQVSGAITASSAGTLGNFFALGISVNGDGTLTLDADTLRSVLSTNYAGVTSLFQDASSLGTQFSQTLAGLSSTTRDGVLYQALQANQTEEQTLNQNVTTEEAIIAAKKTLVTKQLQQANFELQQIPSQLNYVNELYAAVTGYNGGKG